MPIPIPAIFARKQLFSAKVIVLGKLPMDKEMSVATILWKWRKSQHPTRRVGLIF
jgi:hypothetical protein